MSKPRSKSSTQWLAEHEADFYVQLARKEGYRSRAVYKLKEIQERDKILKAGMTVVDLGAAPGGWSQYARPQIGKNGRLVALDILPMDEVVTSYYLRMRVVDRPGVLADITRILADRGISIDAMIQKEPSEGEDQTDIILLTHRIVERNVVDAISTIEALPTVHGGIVRLRLEALN